MVENSERKLMFIHGLEGSSQGFKARLLRRLFPGITTPDFPGTLAERMARLELLLDNGQGWTLVGSSFGGLMAAIYVARRPERVGRLVLLAPALIWPDYAAEPPPPVAVPGVIYHGARDQIIPLEPVRTLAAQTLPRLDFRVVDDDHSLHKTVQTLDWRAVLDIATE